MATPAERKEKLSEVDATLAEVAAVNPEDLARVEQLSREINFTKAVPFLQQMADVLRQLTDRDLSRLPLQELESVNNSAKRFLALVEQIQTFELNQDRPGDICATLTQDVAKAYDGVVKPLLLPLAFTATQATDYAQIEREARGVLSTVKAEKGDLDRFLSSVRDEASAALRQVQEQAAEAGVAQNAVIFETSADTYAESAKRWLSATRWSSLATFCIALLALVSAMTVEPASTQQAIQFIVAKVLVVSVAFFVLVWSSRNYRAARHNETLSQHRADALKTFRAFVEGTSEPSVKDAILVQASQAAFAPRSTGYDGGDNDGPQVQPIVEVFGKALPAAVKAQ